MKTATILPQNYLELTKDKDYHMVLAHLINEPGYEEYTAFYKRIGQDPNKFLIMDTGLIEGNARPVDELVDKAKFIGADEMVLNDIFENHDETLRESHEALEYIESTGLKIRKMAVPQGLDVHDWIECAKEMLTWPVDTIGIPKVLSRDGGMHARLYAIEAIQPYLGDKEIHLLGCWDSPIELQVIENYVRAGKIKPVRGVDSAIPYVYAHAGLLISEAERPQGPIDFSVGEANFNLLVDNIEIWEKAAAKLKPVEELKNEKIIKLL